MKSKVITICASASFFKDVLKVKRQLKKLGYKIKVPKTAIVMKRVNNFDVDTHKPWYKNKKDYKQKAALTKEHFKKVIDCDAVLVANYDKNGIKGYIGGNTLMEMAIAFHYKKPIFILNEISENIFYKEEIYGLNPIFINGDLNRITKS